MFRIPSLSILTHCFSMPADYILIHRVLKSSWFVTALLTGKQLLTFRRIVGPSCSGSSRSLNVCMFILWMPCET